MISRQCGKAIHRVLLGSTWLLACLLLALPIATKVGSFAETRVGLTRCRKGVSRYADGSALGLNMPGGDRAVIFETLIPPEAIRRVS